MRVNLRLLALYGFFLAMTYLSGAYFGSWLLVLYYLLLLYPLLSIAALLTGRRALHYAESFSSTTPVKGQTIAYRLALFNASLLPVHRITIRLLARTPGSLPQEEPLSKVFSLGSSLGPRADLRWEISLQLPYRGVYRLGLEEMELTDILNLVTLRLPARSRTFRVYPRLLALGGDAGRPAGPDGESGTSIERGCPDPTLFSRIREYVSGEPIRDLYWKKFASFGIPFLKEYEGAMIPSFTIYPDLRRPVIRGVNPQAVEDAAVEILVSLARHLLERGVAVEIAAPGFHFSGSSTASFPALYEDSVELAFGADISPADTCQADRNRLGAAERSCLLLTHRPDPELFSWLRGARQRGEQAVLVLSRIGYPPGLRESTSRQLWHLRDQGYSVFAVDSPDTLAADLRGFADV